MNVPRRPSKGIDDDHPDKLVLDSPRPGKKQTVGRAPEPRESARYPRSMEREQMTEAEQKAEAEMKAAGIEIETHAPSTITLLKTRPPETPTVDERSV
jgi:hypothetical protein